MVVNMYIISPKKDWFKPVFFSLFQDCKRPTNSLFWFWSCLVLVQFSCSLLPVPGLDFQTLDDFIVIKFSIKKCAVEVKYFNFPVMACSYSENEVEGGEMSNGSIGFVVVNAIDLGD